MGNTKTKNTKYKEKEPFHRKGSKKYQERITEEKEAEKEIKEYEDGGDVCNPDRFDGFRLERS